MQIQLHDFNTGIAPSGLFWTIRIPDGALKVRGKQARLKLDDVAVVDSKFFLGPDETPARVSLDLTWVAIGPKTSYRPGSPDPADPSNFEGEFRLAAAVTRS